ncbi:MAG: hypothetical protein SGILL_007532 [Bacillariaceae sp.]
MSEESIIVSKEQQWQLAQISNLLLLAISLPSILSPHIDKKLYGTKEYRTKDKNSLKAVRYNGQLANLGTLSLVLAWWSHAEKGLTVEEAIGVAGIPWFVFALHAYLNELMVKMGRSNKGPITILVLNGIAIVATLIDNTLPQNVVTWIVKALSIFLMANGVSFVLIPALISPIYGLPTNEEDHVIVARQRTGSTMSALGVFYAGLLWGATHFLALGMAWATVFIATLFIVPGYRRVKVKMSAMYTWLVVMGFVASVLSYQQPSTVEETA